MDCWAVFDCLSACLPGDLLLPALYMAWHGVEPLKQRKQQKNVYE